MNLTRKLLPLVVGALVALPVESPKIRLVDVAAEAGVDLLNVCGEQRKDYIVEVNGNGAAFFDYDNDGDMDLAIINGSTLKNMQRGGGPMVALYRNDGKGKFSDVTAGSGLTRKGWGMGACVADYDNDGFQDLYVTAFGPNVLYRNQGDGTFSDVTDRAGVGDVRWSTNCAFCDYDRDGDVDLYVANYLTFDEKKIAKRGGSTQCRFMGADVICGPKGLPGEPDALYRNNANGTFTDVTGPAGITDPGYYGFGVIASDLDDDGWPDIFVANDSKPNLLFQNNKNGTFSEIALLAGIALNQEGREQAGMGVGVGDYDGDGRFDIFVTNFSHDTNTLHHNSGAAVFTDKTYAANLGESSFKYLGWGTGFVDLDNDGLLDIFIANGHVYPEIDDLKIGTKFLQSKQVYLNLGNGRYDEISQQVGGGVVLEKSARGAAFADYDNDGDVDVVVINLNDRPTLLRNDTDKTNHWLTLRLTGTKSNRDAIGARVALKAAGRTQVAEVRSGGSYLSHNDSRIHFGLGSAETVDSLEIRWPSGLVETFETLKPDRIVSITEGKEIPGIKKR